MRRKEIYRNVCCFVIAMPIIIYVSRYFLKRPIGHSEYIYSERDKNFKDDSHKNVMDKHNSNTNKNQEHEPGVTGKADLFLNGNNDGDVEMLPYKKYDLNLYSSKKLVEQILRESVDKHHKKYFVKPPNEVCEKRLPSVIILGVAKSGTRELMDFMRLHPHIEISWHSATYENPYFGSKYHKGPEWFKSEMPCSYSNQITVMKNAWYFHNDYVPKKIQSFNESVKLIVVVREPVSRAISQYSFFHRNVGLSGKTYDQVALNDSVVNANIPSLQLSIYDKPMEHWLEYFKLNQFLILESSELKNTPAKVMHRVENFLGLDHYISPEMFVFNKEKGFYCIQSDLTTSGMACYAQDRGRQPIKATQKTIRKLKDYFRPHNERFFEIIGKSFEWD